MLLLLKALTAYGAILALWIYSPRRACVYALGIWLGLLSAYWLYFDHSVHASSRYYLRTVLWSSPLCSALRGVLAAMTKEG